MKLCHLFLFTVFVGVAFGKSSECMKKEIAVCMLMLNNRYPRLVTDPNPCSKLYALVDCLNSATKQCKDEAFEAIENLENITLEVCNAHSETHKNSLEYGKCSEQATFKLKYFNKCFAEHAKGFQNLGKPDLDSIQERSDKMMKLLCPIRVKLFNCRYDLLKSDCGEQAEKYYRKIGRPSENLFTESCDDGAIEQRKLNVPAVSNETISKASIRSPNISIVLIFIQLLVANFSYKNIF